MVNNCLNCMYGENVGSNYSCDRVLIAEGRMCYIDLKDVEKECPCHSSKDEKKIMMGMDEDMIEVASFEDELRYMMGIEL